MNDPNDIRCDLDDAAGLVREIRRRDRIITALMNQVQRNLNNPDNDFSLLQTTFVLEEEVKRRTEELEGALDALAKTKEELQKSYSQLEDRVADRTAELSQQLHFLQQLIEAIPGPVFYKDTQLRYIGCNSAFAAFMGHPAGELIGKTTQDFAPSRELGEAYLAADRELLEKPGSQIYETKVRYANGEMREVMLHKATFTRPDGTIGGLVGLMLDITERKRLEVQLREAQKMEAMGRLAGGIAHDFNNLMTIITGYGNLLRTALEDNPPLQEKVEEIIRAGEQANSLTRQLLAFTRRQMLQPRLLDLRSVLADMGKMLRRVVSEDIELVILSDAEPCLIHADCGQIQQVIMNLVINARDATPKGGKITLAATILPLKEEGGRVPAGAQPGPYVRLTVRDTGHGMDAETRAHIFEPFFTTKEHGKGTGLGLATVYGIVQQTGGHIEVESGPGRGAAFSIYFQRAEGALPEEEGQAVACEPAQGSETILVVEDQDGLRTLVCEILSRNGYTVLPAENGRAALLLAARHSGRIDLMLTDLVMPQMGGSEVAQGLPASHPETKVLYMSGYVEDVDELLARGHAFIDKPFAPEALLQKVRQVLDRRSLRLSA
ncbi:MAG: ATP-binding protein [Candidatus Korobacteraceae bacterium]